MNELAKWGKSCMKVQSKKIFRDAIVIIDIGTASNDILNI